MLSDDLRRIGPVRGVLVAGIAGTLAFAGSITGYRTLDESGEPVAAVTAVSPPATAAPVQGDAGSAAPGTEQDSGPDPEVVERERARDAAADRRRRVVATRRRLAGRVGALVIGGYRGQVVPQSVLALVEDGRLGGVILMGDNIGDDAQVTRATAALRAAAARGGRQSPIIATDQEGGDVKRLASAPPSVSAAEMGASGPAAARREGTATGGALRRLGINLNLAPVADVGPRSSFLGTRIFATAAVPAGRAACAFAAGSQSTGVATALKHFPGLGTAGATSTDDEPVTVRTSAAELRGGWTAYRSCGSAPSTLTMVSNARYPALTGNGPAVFSRRTYALLRSAGASGPVITDALEAGALRGESSMAPRAVRAGATFLLTTDLQLAVSLRKQLERSVRSGDLSRARVTAALSTATAFRRVLP